MCSPAKERRKSSNIPRLHEHGPGARKFTDQAFSRRNAGYDAPRGDPLQDVFAVPGHEMAVVDDVFFAVDELENSRLAGEGGE
jgi:hypothetical protein